MQGPLCNPRVPLHVPSHRLPSLQLSKHSSIFRHEGCVHQPGIQEESAMRPRLWPDILPVQKFLSPAASARARLPSRRCKNRVTRQRHSSNLQFDKKPMLHGYLSKVSVIKAELSPMHLPVKMHVHHRRSLYITTSAWSHLQQITATLKSSRRASLTKPMDSALNSWKDHRFVNRRESDCIDSRPWLCQRQQSLNSNSRGT
jgi:hypothetical protein